MSGSPLRLRSPSTSEKLSSPQSCSPPTSGQTSMARRPLVELIDSQFSPFACEDAVVFPFQDETARDQAFQKEINEMLLDAALESHAWSSSRPFHETDAATRKFETQIIAVQQQESEQEKTRQRLKEFVTRMRSALAALTGM
ncbi:hypothetical protein GGX14DRAFT_422310 [Mycena pura]|uniref:Uncharacterized protein n=1 Tax=Mycena pura TaxID=153505 RepID=A0AAD6YPU4_9AGAR|nr:hypothetical protein GGX14DRAFT_422310 [Mycena pura]